MAVAFFDVDKTLIHANTATSIVKYYRRSGFFGPSMIAWTVFYKILYMFDLVKAETMMQKGLEPFVGRPREEVKAEIYEVFEEFIRPAFYKEALDCLEKHRDCGDDVLLLTSTSWDIADAIAVNLGIDYIATSAELENGLYTNKVSVPIPYGEGKLLRAIEYLENRGERLEDTYFYTDSISDLPLLKQVGHPVCVNPDFFLRRKAQRYGWPIRIFSNIVSI